MHISHVTKVINYVYWCNMILISFSFFFISENKEFEHFLKNDVLIRISNYFIFFYKKKSVSRLEISSSTLKNFELKIQLFSFLHFGKFL